MLNIQATLESYRVPFTATHDSFRVTCPYHDDKTPSGILYPSGGFHCFACNTKTTVTKFFCTVIKASENEVRSRLGYRRAGKRSTSVSIATVEQQHARIWDKPALLSALRYRCINDDTIREYRLGTSTDAGGEHITIPIPDECGIYSGIRYYSPGVSGRKFLNSSGQDLDLLYPYSQLEFDTVLICGGEIKALAAIQVLNKHGIGAISNLLGENNWRRAQTSLLKGKKVYVNCDVDAAGSLGAAERCKALLTIATSVHLVQFTPEQVGNEPKGDLNDFLRLGGDLYKLLLDTPPIKRNLAHISEAGPPADVGYREAFREVSINKRVRLTAIISGISPTYTISKNVQVLCPRGKTICAECGIMATPPDSLGTTRAIGEESQLLMELINAPISTHDSKFKRAFDIPILCNYCKFEKGDEVNHVHLVRLDEQVLRGDRSEPMPAVTGFLVNFHGLTDAQTYLLSGRVCADPRTQLTSFISAEIETSKTSMDEPVDETGLENFVPSEWTKEAIRIKLDEIYEDLEANVTRVYLRRRMHIIYDLCYHSVLTFFLGGSEKNAYVEVLVVGDTGQAKSKAVDALQTHYGLGAKVDCKSVSLPGLTIGLEKSGERYTAIFGALPRNDRGLLVLEELKGLGNDVFSKLTEIRSSGLVRLNKIKFTERRARVRLVAISNPAEARTISSYGCGIDAASTVVPQLEDIRRFDAVLIVGRDDVGQEELAQAMGNPPKVEHKYTGDMCRRLVIKAWRCASVRFEDESYFHKVSLELCKIYDSANGITTPVLTSGSAGDKIAKLSTALAARTNSYDGDTLVVRKCHVDFIKMFLNTIYSAKSCALNVKADNIERATEIVDENGLRLFLNNTLNAVNVAKKLLELNEITAQDINVLVGDRNTGDILLSKLVTNNALLRLKRDTYARTDAFTSLLRTINGVKSRDSMYGV